MAAIRYFVRVPKLPYEVIDQFKAVDIVEYLAPEKSTLKKGQALVRVQTWWAILDLVAVANGYIGKNLYDDRVMRASRIPIGDPLSLIYSDPDDLIDVSSETWCEMKVVKMLREKPKK